MYRTYHYLMKKHSKFYTYDKELCYKSARLYNRANFVVRNYATAVTKFIRFEPLTANELEVYTLIHTMLDGTKYEVKPTTKWLNYEKLNQVLYKSKDFDYNNLPKQTSQQILKVLMRDYKSFL